MSSHSVFDSDDPIDPFGQRESEPLPEFPQVANPPSAVSQSANPQTVVSQPAEPAAPRHQVPEVHSMLTQAIELLEEARPVPLSTAVKLDADPILDLLYDAIELLPQQLREARWLLREREEYLQGVRREGDEITAIARSRAELMVERTEVAKAAERRAKRIIADAEAEARLMRRQTEDFCDARLASLQGILDRTRTVVVTGRSRMQGSIIDLRDTAEEPEAIEAPMIQEPDPQSQRAVFDQDLL